MGMAYKEMGLWQEAIQEFQTASQNAENLHNSLEMLGECYLHLNRHDEAATVFERLVETSNGKVEARLYLRMGQAYEALQRWDDAETAYGLAVELDETLTEAVALLQGLGERRDRGAA
jgi:tetratricopeptide (TPR) repeat protein